MVKFARKIQQSDIEASFQELVLEDSRNDKQEEEPSGRDTRWSDIQQGVRGHYGLHEHMR